MQSRNHPSLPPAEERRTQIALFRYGLIAALLHHPVERGEIGTVPPVEVALSLVTGPLHHRANQLGEPITPAFVKVTIAFAVRALRA